MSTNKSKCFTLVCLLGAFISPGIGFCHDFHVHMAITESAFASSEGVSSFLAETLGNNFPSYPLTAQVEQLQGVYSAKDWLRQGSKMEDEQKYNGWPEVRCPDHFYTVTPGRVAGKAPPLSDPTESPFQYLPPNLANSFCWATQDGIQGPIYLFTWLVSVGQNYENWSSARLEQWYYISPGDGASKQQREAHLAAMLYNLGHIMHLNQDLSSPDHVRNDAHKQKACAQARSTVGR